MTIKKQTIGILLYGVVICSALLYCQYRYNADCLSVTTASCDESLPPAAIDNSTRGVFHGKAGSRNAQANALIRNRDGRIVQALIDDYHDPDITPLWRNYAVQFMGSAAAVGLGTKQLHRELTGIAFDRRRPWAATTLVNVYWLHKRCDLAVPEGLLPQWVAWADHDLIPPHAQASLLNILIELDPAAALALARKRVAHQNDRTLQRAAVRALGLLGEVDDVACLRQLTMQPDEPACETAKHALQALLERRAEIDVVL